MPDLSEIIKRQMVAKNLDPIKIAVSIGVSQRMVEYYIKGTRQPSFKNLISLSKFLDFDLKELSEQVFPKVEGKLSNTDIDFQKKYYEALEEINRLQKDIIDRTKNGSPPLKKPKNVS